ncbi:hypothetical protein ACSVDA_02935 [Cytobacillus sp. Hm23]
MKNTKKFIAAASLSALLIGGGYTALNTEGVPQVSASVKASDAITIPEDTIERNGLFYDGESKTIFNIAKEVLVQFKDGKIYDGDGKELSRTQYDNIREGKALSMVSAGENPLIDEAYIAGINPVGKTNREISDALHENHEWLSLRYEAKKFGIDIKNLTADEIKAEVDKTRLDYIQNHFQEGIKKLKKAYELDPEVYQNVGIDLTDKTDEEIKDLISTIFDNASVKIPLSEGRALSLWTNAFEIIDRLFLDHQLHRWNQILAEAEELGVETSGLSTQTIIGLNHSMKTAIEQGMDIEGKTSQEIYDMVQEAALKQRMKETGKKEEELLEERP